MRNVLDLLEIETECWGKGIFESIIIMLKSINKDRPIEEIGKVTIQDGIGELMLHKMSKYPNVGVIFSDDGSELFPYHFIREQSSDITKNTSVEINNVNYSTHVTLDRAAEAEKLSVAQNRYGLLYLYIIAAGYDGHIIEGVGNIFNAEANEKTLGELKAYSSVFALTGSVELLLNDVKFKNKEKKEINRIALVTNPDLTGGTAYAVPFQVIIDGWFDQ